MVEPSANPQFCVISHQSGAGPVSPIDSGCLNSAPRIARQPPSIVDQLLLQFLCTVVDGSRAMEPLDAILASGLVDDYFEGVFRRRPDFVGELLPVTVKTPQHWSPSRANPQEPAEARPWSPFASSQTGCRSNFSAPRFDDRRRRDVRCPSSSRDAGACRRSVDRPAQAPG